MVNIERDKAVSAVMTVVRVRMKKFVKVRDEIIPKAFKGLF
jgi:hypothetical protein